MSSKETKNERFRELLKLEGKCPINDPYPHRWTRLVWLDKYKVWVRGCGACHAIEIYRGNDTIFYGLLPNKRYELFIFHDRHEFTGNYENAKVLLENIREDLLGST